MKLLTGFVAIVVWLAPCAASAQLFADPFADAAAYRQMRREAPADATYRVRYEVTRIEPNQAPAVSEVTIDVAADWSLTREGDQVFLRDFQLNRTFILRGDSFVSTNSLADIVFRVMERQNRTYLQRIASAAGVQLADDCDADTELGVTMPSASGASATEFGQSGSAVEMRCGGRAVGRFRASDGAAPPAAFWPTMFTVMTTHPALHRRIRETGRAPAQLETSFRYAPDAERRRSWRLVAVETVATRYPLSAALRNTTSEVLDREFAAGIGQVGIDAVAGRAQGGAPTLQSWGDHLNDVARRDGQAAAAMLLLPTYNMFPELEGTCQGAAQVHPLCPLNNNLRAIASADPAPMSVLEIGMAEQQRNNAAVIAAMRRAQASPNRDHPALNASFALALLRFDEVALTEARAASLPTDVDALQAAALRALPYNPAYWTDVGDRYGGAYDYATAFVFYDVAYSLPMPSAVARNRVLVSKREVMQRIRRDFPDATLPPTP
ncbi:hypothetical protein [Terricaulis silvestris]|uniref:Uncharacterized protein n=1 Tax=Terricaulis silvestris TaxID=2686094 RepID=A0A6I6MGQ6_9CAUL|nr:hypothetical protein [Terricaulis silvestris]QGZ93499.1 hypothetical protein DSM104635_00309 [Terricaulis silvestris]